MNEQIRLTQQFEAHRTHLQTVAFRILGSRSQAEDAVQETWLRLHRSKSDTIENLGGWLTTVTARVCLDMLRSRNVRAVEPLDGLDDLNVPDDDAPDPEQEALVAHSVGLAMLVVLELLTPAERVAFVLHDVFDLPFDQIARIVGGSPAAARQLASRARRRVRGAKTTPEADLARQRRVVDAFLAASRDGDLRALVALLDPDAVLEADTAAVEFGAESKVRGARAVASTFVGRARAAQLALWEGTAGAVWAPGGKPRVVFAFSIEKDKITTIRLIADPERLKQTELKILE